MRNNRRNRYDRGLSWVPFAIAGGVILAIITVVVIVLLLQPKRVPINVADITNIQPKASNITKVGDYYQYEDADNHMTSHLAIDVSSHQGEVDWKAVKKAGIDFVYIRLGLRGYESGALALDDYYLENIKAARKAGLNVGVYFFSQAITREEVEEEADFVIENLKDHDIDLQVVYDFELVQVEGSRTLEMEGVDYTANAIAFCKKIQDAGYEPMIYTNGYFAENFYDMNILSSYDIWFANYNEQPELASGFAVWQYTEEGSIETAGLAPLDFDLIFVKENEDK
ncbi:MAG: glycoside hydrolase family 25 protein [Lachnospiraceae bacterium]|nr:glycoside hydrolase family 25 protein [Lachnospiraceae bacterium]MBQ1608986.1 glycoside hydrolase family 25 protein [Lachnospiraceae bacterium]MBQ1641191.1 glycoside hydrolase family 25 protein [Lachnospiraceae bacterium]MBQ2532871.1 glycoside hydrolase family 25 protein [Lachnospiraceae bacterium]MBQ4373150.1 glycoside hydrolase family 25 protein [Lachnospiraceae bacterium]